MCAPQMHVVAAETTRAPCQVLIMEGYEEVSKEADAALQRLLELPKFRGKNWAQMLELGKTKKKKK